MTESKAAISAKWDAVYRLGEISDYRPAEVLSGNAFLLPQNGAALDLACGLGANARLLATAGLAVFAWDISTVAVEKLQDDADKKGLAIQAKQCAIDKKSFFGYRFDVIVISRFLDRSLCDAIIGALNPGGLLFYQTYTREKVVERGPNNPDFLLAEGELLELFAELKLIYYRENGSVGSIGLGLRNEAQFIGRKR
ncbi:class I SAM-dependent methyltransferase [Methylotuvimicrobium buryatense]|uniref:class I SAM-dependent methyltransferase n=1 Tax=Methylotuvimicrobium buryatense TaxID=95641 RepID=UPI00034DDB70|nr:methyltransferase domain-containing protein [Methylotuvimicrobium buryatense]